MIAVLFPGLGAQTPEDRDAVTELAPDLLELGSEVLGDDPFERMFESARYAVPAMFIASQARFRAASFEEEPAFFAGHSIGELGALVAAGGIEAEVALPLLCDAATLMADAEQGGMVAVRLSVGEAEELVAGFDGWVVANDNAPGQVVLAGPAKTAQALVDAVEAKGQGALLLPVNGAFHSPLMKPATDEFGRRLAGTPFEPTEATVFCGATAEPFDDPAVQFAAALSRPVRFREILLKLDAAGVTRYVDVGPGQLVSGLVRRTLPHAERIALTHHGAAA